VLLHTCAQVSESAHWSSSFKFTKADGKVTFGRYQIIPKAGNARTSSATAGESERELQCVC